MTFASSALRLPRELTKYGLFNKGENLNDTFDGHCIVAFRRILCDLQTLRVTYSFSKHSGVAGKGEKGSKKTEIRQATSVFSFSSVNLFPTERTHGRSAATYHFSRVSSLSSRL